MIDYRKWDKLPNEIKDWTYENIIGYVDMCKDLGVELAKYEIKDAFSLFMNSTYDQFVETKIINDWELEKIIVIIFNVSYRIVDGEVKNNKTDIMSAVEKTYNKIYDKNLWTPGLN